MSRKLSSNLCVNFIEQKWNLMTRFIQQAKTNKNRPRKDQGIRVCISRQGRGLINTDQWDALIAFCVCCSSEGASMNAKLSEGLKTTFLVHFIVALIFGLGFLLIPITVGNLYGLKIQETEVWRLLGAAMLGFAASSWFAYKATHWESVRIVVLAEIVWTILGTLVMLYALLFAGFPALGWLNAIILAGFGAAFGWFYSRK